MDSPMKVSPSSLVFDSVACADSVQKLWLQNYQSYTAIPEIPPPVCESQEQCADMANPSPPQTPDQFVDSSPIYPSHGSIGHPEMCRRPCVYLVGSRGPCPAGPKCSYCHLEHTERRVALDKRQREFLRRLSESDAITVVFPHLRAACAKLKLPPAAGEVLELLQARAKIQSEKDLQDRCEDLRKAAPRNLQRILAAMSFACLVNFLPCSKEDDMREALERLRHQYSDLGRCIL
ncbi:unnamed protein product [Symbiodinium natans]|uniref:C3H1-type domain-containing protein n=1 Tax=Symbiodinium natans TaxID=878477 RepID=A0A812TCL7_9DINO|nr:unnamed protein product [Symbiodinium natans]